MLRVGAALRTVYQPALSAAVSTVNKERKPSERLQAWSSLLKKIVYGDESLKPLCERKVEFSTSRGKKSEWVETFRKYFP